MLPLLESMQDVGLRPVRGGERCPVVCPTPPRDIPV